MRTNFNEIIEVIEHSNMEVGDKIYFRKFSDVVEKISEREYKIITDNEVEIDL